MNWDTLKTRLGPIVLPLVKYGLTALTAAILAFLTAWFKIPPVEVPVPDPATVKQVEELKQQLAEANPPASGGGWVNDPDEVQAVAATLAVKVFSETPAGKVEALPAFHYCWKHYEQLYGRPPPIKDQGSVGSCVSFGTNTAIERTLGGEILRRKGTAAEWSRFVEEATYGGSRVAIGGGRIRGDGSVGAWAAQYVTKFGCVPRKSYPGNDLTTYSESLCRKWGSVGVPASVEEVARRFPVKSFVQVKSWTEAKAAISQDYCIAVCSNQGFTQTRDENGVARPSGQWAHCMAIDGYHTENGREWGHIVNSWAKYFKGPNGWGNPQEDGFWAESAVIDRMLRQGDSWAFSGVTGFPARKPINWDVKAVPFKPLFKDMRAGMALAF